MSKLTQNDLTTLRQQFGEVNPNNLVLIQIKKKTPEVYVGGNGVRKQKQQTAE